MSDNEESESNAIQLRSGKTIPKTKTNQKGYENENDEIDEIDDINLNSSSSCDEEDINNGNKVYFVDSNNQIRLFSTSDSDVILIDSNSDNSILETSLNENSFHSFIKEEVDTFSDQIDISIVHSDCNNSVNVEKNCKMALDQKLAYNVIPEFNGSNVDLFLTRCDFIYSPLKAAEDKSKFLLLLKTKFVGQAFEFIKYKQIDDWETFKKEIKTKFSDTRSIVNINLELGKLKQDSGESVQNFANRVEKVLGELNDAYILKGGDGDMKTFQAINSDLALRAFEQGLRDPQIQLIIKACRFTDLKSAFDRAKEEEMLNSNPVAQSNDSLESKPLSTNNNKINCQFCHKLGHTADICYSLKSRLSSGPRPQSFNNSQRFPGNFPNLNQPRMQMQYPNSYNPSSFRQPNMQQNYMSPNNSHSSRAYVTYVPSQIVVCNFCHKVGHTSHDCRKRLRKEAKYFQKQNQIQQFPETNQSEVQVSNSENFPQSLDQNNQNTAVRVQNL